MELKPRSQKPVTRTRKQELATRKGTADLERETKDQEYTDLLRERDSAGGVPAGADRGLRLLFDQS